MDEASATDNCGEVVITVEQLLLMELVQVITLSLVRSQLLTIVVTRQVQHRLLLS